MAYRFSDNSDWVTSHAPRWRRLFAGMAGKPGVAFLEIGSFEGRSAVWWLDNVLSDESSTLVCIDPWAWGAAHEENFDYNLAASGRGHRVRKIKSESRRALAGLPDASFDAVYVDGSHEGRDVLLDGLMALPLLKRDGILLFDDYKWKPDARYPRRHPPQAGIDAFRKLCDDLVELTDKGYQIAFRKR